VLGNLKVLFGKTVSAASIHMNYTTCQGAFADGFHDESAGNIMTLSDHARDDIVLQLRTIDTVREYEEYCLIVDKADTEG
jgi:hypothetical protein